MNTVKCPNCGNENKSTNIRCEKCREQLINEEQMEEINLNPSFNIPPNPIEDSKLESDMTIFSGILITIIGAISSVVVSSKFVFKGTGSIPKIINIPFLICGIAILTYGISMIIKGINMKKNIENYANMNKVEKSEKDFKKIMNIINNIYIWGFLLFWFGFLIVFDSIAIKLWAKGGSTLFFFSIIFWIVGIYVLIHNIRKIK